MSRPQTDVLEVAHPGYSLAENSGSTSKKISQMGDAAFPRAGENHFSRRWNCDMSNPGMIEPQEL